jgi:predicted AlkP superfamily phosphohydrolase/phosphomutase
VLTGDDHVPRSRILDAVARHGKRVHAACARVGETTSLIRSLDADLVWVEVEGAILGSDPELDACLGDLVERLDADTSLVVLAPPRSPAVGTDYFVTNWLAETGFRRLANRSQAPVPTIARVGSEAYALIRALRRNGLGWLPRLLPQRLPADSRPEPASRAERPADVEWSATRVSCASTPAGLRINLRGRDAEGIVAPDDFASTCEAVRAALLALRDPAGGQAVVRTVRLAPDASEGADLVIETADGYRPCGGVGAAAIVRAARDEIDGASGPRNGHFFLAGSRIRRAAAGGTVSASDVGPTLLHVLGVPVPADLKGAVVTAALTATPHPSLSDRRAAGAHEVLGYQ